jgi:hypothetical protein
VSNFKKGDLVHLCPKRYRDGRVKERRGMITKVERLEELDDFPHRYIATVFLFKEGYSLTYDFRWLRKVEESGR